MNEFVQWLQQLQFDGIIDMLIVVLASLLCIMVHEISHGLVAGFMGDNTAKRMGRLSFNPLRHVDPMGLVMMALLRFGWAKAVPVDMRNFRSPKLGMAVTAVAGPISNFLLMLLAVLGKAVVLLLYLQNGQYVLFIIVEFFDYVSILSAGICVFNLLPIPPLDGSKVLFSVLSDTTYRKLMKHEKYGMILLAIVLVSGLMNVPLNYLRNGLLDIAYSVVTPLYNVLLR